MTARLTRTTHGHAPSSSSLEIDDDGHVTGWQTSGHRVGTFARGLSARERASLERALSAAAAAGPGAVLDPTGGVRRPGGTTEQLIADGLPDVVLDPHGPPPPGFEDLVALMLALREDLAQSPVAAIELAVDGPPFAARLRHVGTEPVGVRMSTLTLAATLFDADSAIVDSTTHNVDASGTGDRVGPGWSLPLADDLGLAAPRRGGFLTVTVGTPEVDSRGDGVLRRAELSWMAE